MGTLHPVVSPAAIRSTARPAPLEQLHTFGRELEGGILAIDSDGSRWLIDVDRCCFQRIAREMDVARAMTFGSWEPFEELSWHEHETLVIVPSGPRAQIRVHVQGA